MLEIVGSGNLDTDEYAAALKLEKLIKEEIPNVEEEKDLFIYLIPSVYLARMTTKDIDLVLFYADFRKKNPLKTSYGITVHSFISTIEVKTHVGEGVVFTGTDCSVKYQDKSKPSSATEQARKQMEKLKKHLGNEFYHRKIFSPVPHVLNGIYLINYSKENLPDTVEGVSRSNIFAGDSSFREIVETLVNTNIDFLEKHQLKNQSTFKNIHELE